MTFETLVDFLEKRMSMSHIYQPLLIKSLMDAGGSATIRQLANHFLSQDESQCDIMKIGLNKCLFGYSENTI